ncbi:hypothetical protein ACJMK2_011927 [Sinanodonta woodiana]|uniref:Uncharacterized protein n=1 Tax=Sinanodonta woodiana TaxID=1069815 RepID=A0ABD3V6Y4_SINWO
MEMSGFVHYLWTFLSMLVSVTCTYSLLQPEWFVHADFMYSFGMYAYCLRDFRYTVPRQICGYYGGRFGLGSVPSRPWQAACLLYGGGCMFLTVSFLFALLSLSIRKGCDTTLVFMCTYIQILAVVFLLSGILSFPFGLSSSYFQHYCGVSASIFYPGSCHISWAYMLAIAASSLSIFCPILSRFVENTECEDETRNMDI